MTDTELAEVKAAADMVAIEAAARQRGNDRQGYIRLRRIESRLRALLARPPVVVTDDDGEAD